MANRNLETLAIALAFGVSLLGIALVAQTTTAPTPARTAPRGGRGAQGLPDGRDKLFIPDSDYIRFPLPPGEEKYASIQGTALKKTTADIVAISEKSKADGNLYYGRIAGTPYDKMTSDYVLAAFKKLGLEQTREQEFTLSPQWMPKTWKVELNAAGKTFQLTSAFPFQNGHGTPQGPIEAEAVWVSLGSAADFQGRDVKGKAVVIYSIPTPGGRDHTALTNGVVKRATDAGAAMVFVILGFPGNSQSIASVAPPPVPAMSLGVNDGDAVREAIEAGTSPKLKLSLDVDMVPNLKTHNTWGVLPGADPNGENILIMAHHDGFFDAALDNATGTALMLEIARYYAAIPQNQRRRTLTFLDTSGHHISPDLGASWVRDNARDMLLKTALIVNCEHTSQTQMYLLDNGLMTGNTMGARRWYVSGSDATKKLVKSAFLEFGAPLYTVGETSPGGELGQLGNTAPSFHIIDHVLYHTSLDTLDWTPASGMEAVARAYMKVIDGVNKMSFEDIRGPGFKPRFEMGRGGDQ
jgi:hypothetical protein